VVMMASLVAVVSAGRAGHHSCWPCWLSSAALNELNVTAKCAKHPRRPPFGSLLLLLLSLFAASRPGIELATRAGHSRVRVLCVMLISY
jgi:hypothetical protein